MIIDIIKLFVSCVYDFHFCFRISYAVHGHQMAARSPLAQEIGSCISGTYCVYKFHFCFRISYAVHGHQMAARSPLAPEIGLCISGTPQRGGYSTSYPDMQAPSIKQTFILMNLSVSTLNVLSYFTLFFKGYHQGLSQNFHNRVSKMGFQEDRVSKPPHLKK